MGDYTVARVMKRIGYALYAASLSVIVLAIAALFLVVENTAVTLIWEVWAVRVPSRWTYAVPVAVVSTLLLIWGKRRWGDIPHTTRDVLGALKRGEAINYHTAWRDLLIALIILAAGAGAARKPHSWARSSRIPSGNATNCGTCARMPTASAPRRYLHGWHALPSHAMD